MEIIKYLRDGVTATIRFDYLTRTYFGELSGIPSASVVESSSYEEIQDLLLAEMNNYLSGGTADAEDEWTQVFRLKEGRARNEPDSPEPEPPVQETAAPMAPPEPAMNPVKLGAVEKPGAADYGHRKYLLR